MSTWGLPPDAPAWLAALCGLALLYPRREQLERALLAPSRLGFVAGISAASALLSLGYIGYYLQGGPRIIDATSYLLQARVLAQGELTFSPEGPLPSFHSRFLYATAAGTLSPIFPPGYPLILALFVQLGAPLLLGPLLAALLTWLTYALSRQLTGQELIARLAALASGLCAVLRYHTADTMSHGWAALLFTAALLWGSARTARVKQARSFGVLAGLCLGWLFATRPLSGLTAAFALLALAIATRTSWRRAVWIALGAAPAVALFLWHQQALSGAWGRWVQHAYYATVDGPPGCIRIGFGADIGCRVEHGDFVRHYLPNGYGLRQALGTTGRRLAQHFSDVSNAPLGFALCIAAMFASWRKPALCALSVASVFHVLAYAGFYFDGNYPGGGARMFAELLPLEHLLLAWGVVHWRLVRWLLPATLLGFAVYGAHQHQALKQREGGLPMFEAERLEDDAQLVFVNTDHGFNLGFAPERRGPLIARLRGDAYDRALWEHHGRPKTLLYDYDPSGARAPRLLAFQPEEQRRFEAESAWPARALSGGWAEPRYVADVCASQGRVLLLHPSEGKDLQLSVQLWVQAPAHYALQVYADQAPQRLRLRAGQELDLRETVPAPGACPRFSYDLGPLAGGALELELHARDELALDAFELQHNGKATP